MPEFGTIQIDPRQTIGDPFETRMNIVCAGHALYAKSVGIIAIRATAEEIIFRRERHNRRFARNSRFTLLRVRRRSIQKSCDQGRSLDEREVSSGGPEISFDAENSAGVQIGDA